jgi:competence ComEA-like helix-hairpin-helix protein
MLRYAALLFIMIAFACGCGRNAPVTVDNSAEASLPVSHPNAININTASAEELQRLPHIGPKKAAAIIEYRERRGGFRRPEQLMLVDGISDKLFRSLRPLIAVE